MDLSLSPEERARLQAEWAKGNKWGAAVARRRALATVVSTAVFGLCLLPGLLFFSVRLAIAGLLGGVPLGMLVRRALMPKGQFGGG